MNDTANANNQSKSSADSSNQKISDSQKRRDQQYKKAIDDIPHVTMGELLGNPQVQEYINHLVKTQIDEMVLRKQQPNVSIPNIEIW